MGVSPSYGSVIEPNDSNAPAVPSAIATTNRKIRNENRADD